MSDPGRRRSPWWESLDLPNDLVEPIEDPWVADDGDSELNREQLRFLESLADQPAVPRFSDRLRGQREVGSDTDREAETGD